MRVRSCFVGLAIVSLGISPATAQDVVPETARRLSFDVAAGVSRYGPHAATGLEYAMNRWLAARTDVYFSLRNWTTFPAASRLTAVSIAAVASAPERLRMTPYLLGGYGISASQGFRPELGPMGGVGLRLRLGRFSPYIETRAQHTVGVPISIGVRF